MKRILLTCFIACTLTACYTEEPPQQSIPIEEKAPTPLQILDQCAVQGKELAWCMEVCKTNARYNWCR